MAKKRIRTGIFHLINLVDTFCDENSFMVIIFPFTIEFLDFIVTHPLLVEDITVIAPNNQIWPNL